MNDRSDASKPIFQVVTIISNEATFTVCDHCMIRQHITHFQQHKHHSSRAAGEASGAKQVPQSHGVTTRTAEPHTVAAPAGMTANRISRSLMSMVAAVTGSISGTPADAWRFQVNATDAALSSSSSSKACW